MFLLKAQGSSASALTSLLEWISARFPRSDAVPQGLASKASCVPITLLSAGVAAVLWFDFYSAGDDRSEPWLATAGLVLICLISAFSHRMTTAHRHDGPINKQALAKLYRDLSGAQTANLAKSRHLASISHEIRSPLNAIYGYAQLVERDDEVEAREAARVIRRCAEHLNSLVDGLLDISQIEHGVFRLKPDVVRLRPFLDQVVWMLRPSAAAKGLQFEYVLPAWLPDLVRMDQSRLRQVLINLLTNAIKFTDAGSVTLKVSYSGQIARFEISDTGPGIPPEDHGRIFDPFERGATANDAGRPGVGLGLPIARAIVDILGGKLELSSGAGVGARFTVTMMLAEVTGKLEHRAPTRHVAGYLGPRRSILIAEDDPEQLTFLETLLRSLGFEVTAVPDGETALAHCATRRFDLVMLDIALPGISGWETAFRLRDGLGHDSRILMLSANADEFHKPNQEHPTHDLFILKPVEFGALIEAVGGLLRVSWQYTALELPKLCEPPDASAGEALTEEAREHVARLLELLRIGHVRGIEAELRLLAAADPQAAPLVEGLLAALDRFDLAAMVRTLDGV